MKCPHCNSSEVELRPHFRESALGTIQVMADCKTCGSELEAEFHYQSMDVTFERNNDKE